MAYNFYAYMDRMKYIKRWQLMRSLQEENIMEHSQSVAVLTHALAVISNQVFGGKVDEGKAVLYAVYHETSEVITGDLPTPIKYFNHGIQGEYKSIEKQACQALLTTLPQELQGSISRYVLCDETCQEYKLMKAADRLAAYVKCLEEVRSGNKEFILAKNSIEKDLKSRNMPEVNYFFEHFIDGYSLTLDEMHDFKQ